MSEGGAESAGEENSDTKADFFERRGERRKYICKHSASPSLPPTLTFFFLFFNLFLAFLPSATAHKTSSGAIRVHSPTLPSSPGAPELQLHP